MMRPNIALLLYHTKHGTEAILFRTAAEKLEQLPEITNQLLERAGVFDPELSDSEPGGEEDESAEWVCIIPFEDLPILRIGTTDV